MIQKTIKKPFAFLLIFSLLALVLSVLALAAFADTTLLSVEGDSPVTNTSNPFLTALADEKCNGITLSGDYGSESLSVSLVSGRRDTFTIDLNGHTLTLGYLAVNMNVEIRGEGELCVTDGIVVYAGEIHFADRITVSTDAEIALLAHGANARIRVGAGIRFIGSENTVAEFGARYEYKDSPIAFDALPEGAGAGGTVGVDFFRVIYENCRGEIPSLALASIARFPCSDDATVALERGIFLPVNPLDGSDTESPDDDSFLKVVGDTVTVGKSGAILSHANLSLSGHLGVNFYFELSGVEGSVESLGALTYSGVGLGGRIELPEKNDDGKYKFTVPISPMDMGKNIILSFENDPDGKTWEYSVVKYARHILSDTENIYGRELKDLIASMLNYGAALQKFSGDTGSPANAILDEFEEYSGSDRIAEKVSAAVEWLNASGYAYENISYSGEDNAIRFSGITLAVNDITAIRLYLESGYPSKGYSYYLSYHNVAASGSVYERTELLSAERINRRGYIQISDIFTSEFGRVFKISVKENGSGLAVATCETTVLNYALKLYERSELGTPERELAEALIWYGAQSVLYFGGVPA